MSETVRRMLIYGIAAARAGEIPSAQRYLERVLYHDADLDQRVKAHLWLSRIATAPAEQRDHLEEVLAADPTHGEAQRALAILDGTLNPDEIVDPDHLPSALPATSPQEEPAVEPQPIAAQRMICPQCGGKIRFEPGKSWLECRYCGHRQTILAALKTQPALKEENFVITLATAKGHLVPEGLRGFQCQGCQATLLTSNKLSTHCPYCGSTHVVEVDTQATIAPEGVIAFVVAKETAEAAFRGWLVEQLGNNRERPAHIRTTRLRGVYLPMWTFDLMGEIGWRGVEPEDLQSSTGAVVTFGAGGLQLKTGGYGRRSRGPVVHEGSHYILGDDAIVPATHKIPFGLHGVFERFDLTRAVPYDPAFLSDWPAEIYEVAVGDASLVARRQALEKARSAVRRQAIAEAGRLENLQTFSRNLSVQSYKLLLVPLWIANYRDEDKTYTVVVNGQTGEVFGEKPPGIIKRTLQGLLGIGDT